MTGVQTCALPIFAGDEKKQAKEHLIILFNLVDPADPRLVQARKDLASALF